MKNQYPQIKLQFLNTSPIDPCQNLLCSKAEKRGKFRLYIYLTNRSNRWREVKGHTLFLWRYYFPCFNWQLKWTRIGYCLCVHDKPRHIKSEGCTIKKKKVIKTLILALEELLIQNCVLALCFLLILRNSEELPEKLLLNWLQCCHWWV